MTMQNAPSLMPETPDAKATTRNVLSTALLASAVLLIPVVLGLLFVLLFQRLSPGAPQCAADSASVTNVPSCADATNVAQLVALHRDLRSTGYPTDEVSLRLWAARAAEPELLFSVPPPASGAKWAWHLSQDGLHALAVARQADPAGRRRVGLYDLAASAWCWTNTLPWPDAHESPYVFDGNLVVRYAKNARGFAMEVSKEGRITAIDTLRYSAYAAPAAPAPDRAFPGMPVAARNGVFFAADPSTDSLLGYALEKLPGLRYAGKGDHQTLFSGNGLLKFTIRDGRVTVCDSLTQTVLQRIDAWPHATNTLVTGALTTHDGARISVFLKTDFGGVPAVTREWSVAIALYTGTVVKSFNADALFSKPRPTASQRQALSPDKRWLLAVDSANSLTVTSTLNKREVARVALSPLLGQQKPVEHLAFLEEGRYLLLRQQDNFWLLDFSLARGYADLLMRKNASTSTPPPSAAPASEPLTNAAPSALSAFPSDEASEFEEASSPFFSSYSDDYSGPSPSFLALRAEWFAANQAWPYAAALLEKTQRLQEYDYRAPRVNPLLLARCQLLSGHRQQAQASLRAALLDLLADPTDYNRMLRYHLQGLLFAKP